MKISVGAYNFLQAILARLNEKTSVTGYALMLAGLLGTQYQGELLKVAAITSTTAGIVLFVIRDAWIKERLTGQKPAPLPTVSVPPPQDKTDSTTQG